MFKEMVRTKTVLAGTHSELLQMEGIYYRLNQLQYGDRDTG